MMRCFFYSIVFVCLVLFNSSECKGEEKPIQGVVLGYNGFEYNYLEIGYCFGHRINWQSSEKLQGYGGLTIGTEISKQEKIIIAPKISYSINMYVSFGVNILLYTDIQTATLQFRPEIGASLLGIRLVLGRNFSVGNYPFYGVNKNNYALTVLIPT